MKKRFLLSLLLFQLAALGGALAHGGGWRDLPPEERRQMRQQMREQWQQDSEMRRSNDGYEARQRWREVPPEDRRRMREEMRDQHGGWRNRPDERGGRRD